MANDHHLESRDELFRQLRNATAGRRLVLLSGPAVVLLLAAYHLVLFWDRVADQSLFQPQVALRWLLTLAFLRVAWRFRAAGVPIFRGRRALVFWLMVALLHASFVGPLAEDGRLAGAGGAELSLLFTAPAVLIAGLVLALMTRRVFGGSTVAPATGATKRLDAGPASRFVAQAGFLPTLCRRPPPA